MTTFGIVTVDEAMDSHTVKAVQERIIGVLKEAGVNFAPAVEIIDSKDLSEGKMIVSTQIEFALSQEDVDDIMCGAMEGGINYWCYKVEVVGGKYLGEYASEQISRGGKLRFYLEEPFDKDETMDYDLDLDKLVNGIKLWIENPVGCNCLVQIDGKMEIDTCNADAIVCDAFIQYALFGEVVFG